MKHLEFIDGGHFEQNYHRRWAKGSLSKYIDFCWETDFGQLLSKYPEGFSDVLFPNIGYTYLVNLSTPFVMQLADNHYEVKSGGFLPRHRFITCHHSVGNHFFGIKFRVCPVLFQKEVDFSEYKASIFPLAYLVEKQLVDRLKNAASFSSRVSLVFNHYANLVEKHEASLRYVEIVTSILNHFDAASTNDITVEQLATENGISKRTLQRYFQMTTGFSTKPALQTIRMRRRCNV